uniref:Uncharacterized protein n=1 Tax=Anopheles stephensi TaxID=30069 RepID=A0A182Y684_ANOST
MYNHQQGILPSSKKDIQYNLSKLNPTSSLGTKGNVNIPMKGIGFYSHGKSLPHPLLHYQKKSPSKNILIPTSTAAATLASLGLPTPLHPPLMDNSNNWVSSKVRDNNTKSSKNVKPTTTVETVTDRSGVAADGKRSVSWTEPTVSNPTRPSIPVPVASENADPRVEKSSLAKPIVTSNHAIQSPVTNNVPVPVQPNLAGFTAVKSGTKLSVHKMQLVPVTGATPNAPLTPIAPKSNVIILPKSSAVAGVLNLGQKITIPKSIVDSSTIVPPAVTSPPKVIVQTVPNPYSVTTTATFDMNIYRQNAVPSPKLRVNEENANPSAISNSTIVHKAEDSIVTSDENQCIDHRNDDTDGGKAVPSTVVDNQLSEGPMDTSSQSEYDMVSMERGDDSSVTDSADAEDDLDDEESQTEECDGVEEDDFGDEPVEVEMETEAIIIEEEPANYDHLIEEVPEDEQFVEEEVEDGPMEFISVGYGTTGELVAELESSTAAQQFMEANGEVVHEESVTNYDHSSEGFAATVENGNLQTLTVSDGIVCDLLEMDSDGKYHARPYSYKQMLAEGMPSAVPEAVKQQHPTVRLS